MTDEIIKIQIYDDEGVPAGMQYIKQKSVDSIRMTNEQLHPLTINELCKCQKLVNEQHEELQRLRHEKRLWLKVCRFEKKRQEKFYEMMFIDGKSDFGMYLAAVKELAEDE